MWSPEKESILQDLMEDWLSAPRQPHGMNKFSEQTVPRQVFLATWELWEGVQFDGLCLYFHNKTETVRFVIEALLIIGAPTIAGLLSEAISLVFPHGLPESDSFIRSEAERIYFHDPSAALIRDRLQELTNDMKSRTVLLGYYFGKNLEHDKLLNVKRLIHIEWIVRIDTACGGWA